MGNLADRHEAKPSDPNRWRRYPMAASTTIYQGSTVAIDITTGHVEPAINDSANKRLVGVAQETVTSIATAGATFIRVLRKGGFFRMKKTSPVAADRGKLFYIDYTADPATVRTTAPTNQLGIFGECVDIDAADGSIYLDSIDLGLVAATGVEGS